MIYERAIREWNETVPWKSPQMVEQDLVICRALVSIFSDEFLRAMEQEEIALQQIKVHMSKEEAIAMLRKIYLL